MKNGIFYVIKIVAKICLRSMPENKIQWLLEMGKTFVFSKRYFCNQKWAPIV